MEHNAKQRLADLNKGYGELVDRELRQLFSTLPPYTMYKHLSYFMGFCDEKFEPIEVYGGKRFRPSLALMLGEFYKVKQETLPFALSLELFHNFTLIHDDIVDKDTHRRGRSTVWNVWGVPHAINSGDAQALLGCEVMAKASADPRRVLEAQSFVLKHYVRVTEGQYLDFSLADLPLGDSLVTVAAYNEMIGRKTADLVAASSGVVGILANVGEDEREALIAYGKNIGLGYQVRDDVTSIWGGDVKAKGRLYNDLHERKKTLPILHAYTHLISDDRQKLVDLYNKSDALTETDIDTILSLLEKTSAKEEMQKVVDGYIREAKQAAESLSIPEEEKHILYALVDAFLSDSVGAKS